MPRTMTIRALSARSHGFTHCCLSAAALAVLVSPYITNARFLRRSTDHIVDRLSSHNAAPLRRSVISPLVDAPPEMRVLDSRLTGDDTHSQIRSVGPVFPNVFWLY